MTLLGETLRVMWPYSPPSHPPLPNWNLLSQGEGDWSISTSCSTEEVQHFFYYQLSEQGPMTSSECHSSLRTRLKKKRKRRKRRKWMRMKKMRRSAFDLLFHWALVRLFIHKEHPLVMKLTQACEVQRQRKVDFGCNKLCCPLLNSAATVILTVLQKTCKLDGIVFFVFYVVLMPNWKVVTNHTYFQTLKPRSNKLQATNLKLHQHLKSK